MTHLDELAKARADLARFERRAKPVLVTLAALWGALVLAIVGIGLWALARAVL